MRLEKEKNNNFKSKSNQNCYICQEIKREELLFLPFRLDL